MHGGTRPKFLKEAIALEMKEMKEIGWSAKEVKKIWANHNGCATTRRVSRAAMLTLKVNKHP